MAATAVLIIIASAISPSAAYVERQLEFCSGNLLFQDQFYFTAPTQTLFHSQTSAGTDTEAFAFSPVAGGGFALAQTSAASQVAADTGFFTAFSSFKKFSCPTGEGYMHTSINDPLVSRTPVFSSLKFPAMIKKDEIRNLAGDASQRAPFIAGGPVQGNAMMSSPPKRAATDMPAIDGIGNTTLNNLAITEPLIKKQFSSNRVGEPDTSNILAVTPAPTPRLTPVPAPVSTPQPAPAFAATTANISGQGSPTPAPSPAPTPRSPYAVTPKAATLLTKPLSRQANKPFTPALDPDYNPRTACRADVANISGWDRLTTNVIGRSGICSTYMNRTSYPSYINPYNSIKLANQFDVMSETLNMTHPGTYLQQRMWAL